MTIAYAQKYSTLKNSVICKLMFKVKIIQSVN